ncbi:MAG: hypothetical protein E7676_07335 [Ruminococcaceae bacterium]|nr:hypothetical protein [Oscillospiraceae bacterium]
MKKTFLFCTKIWFYLTELAPTVLLLIAINYNDDMDGGFRLYPLIAFSVACIIFIFLYFFRMVIISKEEIRTAGLFSSRDSAVVEKDTTLKITLGAHRRIDVELFGKRKAPDFTWSKQDITDEQIRLFHEKAVGGEIAVKRILTYFGVSIADVKSLLSSNTHECSYNYFNAEAKAYENKRVISLHFTKTV